MKTLYLLQFAVAYLAFQIQAQPDPKYAICQVDDNNPVDELALAQLKGRMPCYDKRGYCALRQMKCDSGFVFVEQFNNCHNTRTLKCCVLRRAGLGD